MIEISYERSGVASILSQERYPITADQTTLFRLKTSNLIQQTGIDLIGAFIEMRFQQYVRSTRVFEANVITTEH